jgi:outer membrane protein assembly factor BamB
MIAAVRLKPLILGTVFLLFSHFSLSGEFEVSGIHTIERTTFSDHHTFSFPVSVSHKHSNKKWFGNLHGPTSWHEWLNFKPHRKPKTHGKPFKRSVEFIKTLISFKQGDNYEIAFSAPVEGRYYFIRINNGVDGNHSARSSKVWLNGKKVFSNRDFRRRAKFLEKAVYLNKENILKMNIKGRPGSSYNVEVYGVDNHNPEILASTLPEPNINGWHNSDLLVNFECSDALSGVDVCTDDIEVQTEGKAQSFSGSVSDKAANTAQASISVNLDKTTPSIEAEVIGNISSYAWYNTDVTINYSCNDELSGLAFCSESDILIQDGENQAVQGSVKDIAGNQQVINHLISIDKTKPTITSSLSSQANSKGWYSNPVTITYLCFDNLSGVVSCPDPKIMSMNGIDRLIIAEVSDKANNTANDVQRINLDMSKPELRLVSHENDDLLNIISPTFTFLITDNLSLDAASFTVSLTNAALNCDKQGGIIRCNVDGELAEGKLTLQAQVADNAGNITTFSFNTALDLDGDSIANHLDQCPGTPSTEAINDEGCAYSQLDDDADGIANALDRCLNTLADIAVAIDGCDPTQRDTDLDSIIDVEDAFPNDATETNDLDRDGIGDNADDDIDGDGFSNIDEIAAGSSPADANKIPELKFLSASLSDSYLVEEGQSTELIWQSQGASSVYLISNHDGIIQEHLELSGNLTIIPTLSTSFTLVAKGPNGEVSFNSQVEVELPTPTTLWPKPTSLKIDSTGSQVGTSLSLTNAGDAYVGAYDLNYYKISANGQRLWALENIGVVISQATFIGTEQGEQASLIIAADTSETENSDSNGSLYRINADKTIVWSLATESAAIASPAISTESNEVYAITNQGTLYVVNANTGIEIWQLELASDDRFTAKPTFIPTKNLLIINGKSGKIYAVSTVNKEVLWVRDLK